MEMEREREPELQNRYEDLRKCNLCHNFIEEDNMKRIVVCSKALYYHPICLNLMCKKMESLGFLYSC